MLYNSRPSADCTCSDFAIFNRQPSILCCMPSKTETMKNITKSLIVVYACYKQKRKITALFLTEMGPDVHSTLA